MDDHKYDVLILAGGGQDPFAKSHQKRHKCLIQILGRPMICWVIDALVQTKKVRRIYVSNNEPEVIEEFNRYKNIAKEVVLLSIESQDSISSSIMHALKSQPIQYPLLITTSDHPLLDADIIQELFKKNTNKADILIGLVKQEKFTGIYIKARRTLWSFGDGQYASCNLFILNNKKAENIIDFYRLYESGRKKVFNVVRKLHLYILVIGAINTFCMILARLGYKYIYPPLSLNEALKKLGIRLKLNISKVYLSKTKSAIDIDNNKHLEFAKKILTLN